jgi:DNA gyrase subunit A
MTDQIVIQQKEFTTEFKHNYSTYANYVIRDRAIPSVEDGLKPVHRRIIYSMHKIGLVPTGSTKKCARPVAEAMGKYHPHGDKAIYDSLIRLGQDFLTRYPLVSIQGNKGCVDDPSSFAASRYTECKLSPIAMAYLDGLNENAVDFIPNFDETEEEPVVLPCKLPVPCLANGTHGIGVTLTTNIPPHNISELADGTLAFMNNSEITVEELMQHVQGPDFPGGGQILGSKDIYQAYSTGKASVPIRGKVELIDDKKSRHLLITELPYLVTGEELKDNVIRLIEEKKISGVGTPINETKSDIRLIIPLKKDTNPSIVINALYKYTRLQTSFTMNMTALDENKIPRVWTLKEFISQYVSFRTKVIVRETQFNLKKNQDRLHIQDGLIIALENIEGVISDIKSASSTDEARQKLMTNYAFSEIQANKVLEIQLRRLAALERERIYQEQKELRAAIAELQGILDDPEKVRDIIKVQLNEVKTKFGDVRRTEISVNAKATIDLEATIINTPTAVMITKMGYVKRIPPETVNEQKKGSKGSKGIDILDNDWLIDCFNCNSHDTLLVFTTKGKVYPLKAYLVPEKSKNVKGTNLVNLLQFDDDELVSTVIPVNQKTPQNYLILVTKNGMACKVDKSAYDIKGSRGYKTMRLREGDELLAAKLCNEDDIALFGTDSGYFAKIPVREFSVRLSRTSSGSKCMNLKKHSLIVGFDVINEEEASDLVIITKQGIGKKINISEVPCSKRATVGRFFIKMKEQKDQKNQDQVASFCLVKTNSLMVITSNGIVNKISAETLKGLKGRTTTGSTLIKLNAGDEISSISNAPIDEQPDLLEPLV